MRLTLKNLRQNHGWNTALASKIFGIKEKKLKAYEEYKLVPPSDDVIKILKICKINYIEVFNIIYEDIARNYKRTE